MENKRISKTKRTIKHLKFFKPGESRAAGNLIAPVNDFPGFAKEELRHSIPARFEAQVEKYPDRAAVKADTHTLTYKELDGFANRVARAILETYDDRYRLNQKEKNRYARQMILHQWGIHSQEKLKAAAVFVGGAGGSGSPLMVQLALAGFGTIIVCDHDEVELSNLNRQVLHDETKIGMNKALSAKSTIQRINPHVNVIAYPEKITRENVSTLVGNAQIIFDNVDDPEAKFILSQCAAAKQIPHILSSMIDLNAYAVVLYPPRSPCFHCLYNRDILKEIEVLKSRIKNYKRNPNPVAAPPLFMSTGFVVNEAIKIILGLGKPSYNKYMLFNQRGTAEIAHTDGYRQLIYPFTRHFRDLSRDQGFDWDEGWTGNPVEIIEIKPDPHCPLCGKNPDKNTLSITMDLKESDAGDNNIPLQQGRTGKPGPQTVALLFGQGVDMAVGIIGALKAAKAYMPLDPAYPPERLKYMLEDSESRLIVTDDTGENLAGVLRDSVNKNIGIINIHRIHRDIPPGNLDIDIAPDSLAYILYTSGSTGKPKGVMQSHGNVLHFVRVYTNALHLHPGDRLTLFSSYGFDAAKMDIFGALLNGATLYPYDIKREGSLLHIAGRLRKERITVFHSIPTLYRYFVDSLAEGDGGKGFPDLRFIVMGGEPVFKKDVDNYKKYFPDECLFINGLGPTESTVTLQYFINKETEIVKEAVPVGFPVEETEVFLINEKGEEARVYEVGEILYKSNYLALGYWNNFQKSEEVFGKDPLSGKGRVYYSGDLGRRLPDGSIEYVGRKDFQVKVRGYRIELTEIEACLDQIKGIRKSAVVCSRDPGGEAYLTAYYREEAGTVINENNLAQQLKERLPDYMIPAAFYRLTEFPLTATGKIDRKALAEASLSGNTALNRAAYAPPRNPIEEKMAGIWAGILKIESPSSIGIDDNFFVLGGHSLKATMLVSKIRKEFTVEIPLVKFFNSPTIRQLAALIKSAKLGIYNNIKPVEKREFYPQSSAQKRLFFLDRFEHISISYNMPYTLQLDGKVEEIDTHQYENTFKTLIKRHEILRSSFRLIDNQPVQVIHDKVGIEFKIRDIPPAGQSIEEMIDGFIQPFDLSRAPLFRVGMVKLSRGRCLLLFDMHHIVNDGSSTGILVKEFTLLQKEGKSSLPALPIQYKDFSQWQNRLFAVGEIQAQENYWLSIYADARQLPGLKLPTDFPRPEIYSYEGDTFTCKLEAVEAAHFKNLASQHHATLYMNLLAVFNILLYKYTRQTDIIVGCAVAGRRHADLQEVPGMFVNMLAMRNYPSGDKTYRQLLDEIKTNSVNAFENQDLQFETLVDKLELPRDISRNPLFSVSLVLQNMEHSQLEVRDISISPYIFKNNFTKFDISIHAGESEDEILFSIIYYKKLFLKETIRRLSRHYFNIIHQVIQHPGIRLSEIDILTKEERELLLHQFNRTTTVYPGDQTLHRLFERQVDKTPHITAVVFNDACLTYSRLEGAANRAANYLFHEKQVQPDDRVGILMDRSIDLIVAMLGILKAGGAYVPIDCTFPEERIANIIADGKIRVVISGKKYIRILNRLQWECSCFYSFLCIDSPGIYSEIGIEERDLLNQKKMWEYVGETAADEIAGGGWNNSFTGEPFSKKEMDEYGDNILKKLTPLLHPKMRVLEIGCASGISMYRIAPKVGFYYGTDLSTVIIEKNKKRVDREGHQNIALAALPAHEIDRCNEKDFDLVILNSVIQSFYDHNHLRTVLRKCVNLIKHQGYLFVGDVMDHRLKRQLTAELDAFRRTGRNKKYKTKNDFSTTLFVHREFFEDLTVEIPAVKSVQFSNKIYTIENELTRFRYDALIKVEKVTKGSKSPGTSYRSYNHKQKHKYQDDLSTLETYGTARVNRKAKPGNLAYVIYTSGSSGVPKGVLAEHRNVLNTVAWFGNKYIPGNDGPVHVLLMSDYTFDPSVNQVFGSLLYGAVLYITGKDFLLDIELLRRYIDARQIHILNFVPIMLNELLFNSRKLESIRFILSGGERLDNSIKENIIKHGYRLYNQYGPTETTIDATVEQCGTANVTLGRPIANTKCYILDQDRNPAPIGVVGELYIAGPGVTRGYLNNPELTAEKFLTASTGYYRSYKSYIIYKTGDLVRWLADGKIDFIGRADTQMKIRGYRIETGEIETHLLNHEEIQDAVVLAKEDEKGEKFLCAYIVSKDGNSSSQLREYLTKHLPVYMIPANFVHIKKIPLTPGGKVDRSALSDPRPEPAGDYTAPGNEMEETLAAIWAGVLGIEKEIVGIDSNFFDLGGHSLKAVILVSRIHRRFNVKIPLAKIFKSPFIRELSAFIKDAVENKYASLEAAEKKEYYALASPQKRLFIIQQTDKNSIAYNLPQVIELEGELRKEELEKIIRKLIKRHDSLRTSFLTIDGEPAQRVNHEVEFEIEWLAAAAAEDNHETREIHERVLYDSNFIKPFDLSRAPLLKVGVLEVEEKKHLLMVDKHHIISDAVSKQVLSRDFMALYAGGIDEEREPLPPLRLQYKDYSEWFNREGKAETGAVKRQEAFWLKVFKGRLPLLNLPMDYARPAVKGMEGDRILFAVGEEETKKMKTLALEENATLYMVVLAIYTILLSKLSGQEDIIVGTPTAGRRHHDLEQIIGMFVGTLALRNYPAAARTFIAFLREVKQRTLDALENQDYPFEDLLQKIPVTRDPARNPLFDVFFQLSSFHVEPLKQSNLEIPPIPGQHSPYRDRTSKFDLYLYGEERGGSLMFSLEYSTQLFKQETIEMFIKKFKEIVSQIVENTHIKLEDIIIFNDIYDKEIDIPETGFAF